MRPSAGRSPRRDPAPDASVIVPVNAQGDLDNVKRLLSDVSRYEGPHRIETVLVVNNFGEREVAAEITGLRRLADQVLAIPDVRKPGEAVGFSARIPGLREASSEHAVLFDADCRIPDPSALLDWYVDQLRGGAAAAYTHVGYHEAPDLVSVRFSIAIHHTARWIKRRLLRIPTTRGSNYAVQRSVMLELYDAGLLADEMNVGPTMKRLRGPVVYGGGGKRRVLTSARMIKTGWRWMLPYFIYRLRYNLRVLPVRKGVARLTGRENDPVRRYRDNRPIE